MTGRLFHTIAMLVPIAVRASVRSLSSIGIEKALIAKANAAKRPPTNVPTMIKPKPEALDSRVTITSSSPGKGCTP